MLLERELDLGKQWYKERSLEEAALQFCRVVQMARLTPSPDRLVEARALGNHATVLRDLGKLDEAILAYRLCCRILGMLGEKQLERRMLNGLSLCYVEAGRWADARDVCQGLLLLTDREDNRELIQRRLAEAEGRLREEEGGEGEEEQEEEQEEEENSQVGGGFVGELVRNSSYGVLGKMRSIGTGAPEEEEVSPRHSAVSESS